MKILVLDVSTVNVGIIGFGKMGTALAAGLIALQKTGRPVHIKASCRDLKKHEKLAKELGVQLFDDNLKVLEGSELVLIAVKPQNALSLLSELSENFEKSQLLLSVCAQLRRSDLVKASGLPDKKVFRAMPNIPSLIGQGTTVFCGSNDASQKDIMVVSDFFKCVGYTEHIDESHIDGATAIAGCGPAYVFEVIDALAAGGVHVGLPRELATRLAAATIKGSAQMQIEKNEHPSVLKDQVSTPGGVTIMGLRELYRGNVRSAFVNAVIQATKRSKGII